MADDMRNSVSSANGVAILISAPHRSDREIIYAPESRNILAFDEELDDIDYINEDGYDEDSQSRSSSTDLNNFLQIKKVPSDSASVNIESNAKNWGVCLYFLFLEFGSGERYG